MIRAQASPFAVRMKPRWQPSLVGLVLLTLTLLALKVGEMVQVKAGDREQAAEDSYHHAIAFKSKILDGSEAKGNYQLTGSQSDARFLFCAPKVGETQ